MSSPLRQAPPVSFSTHSFVPSNPQPLRLAKGFQHLDSLSGIEIRGGKLDGRGCCGRIADYLCNLPWCFGAFFRCLFGRGRVKGEDDAFRLRNPDQAQKDAEALIKIEKLSKVTPVPDAEIEGVFKEIKDPKTKLVTLKVLIETAGPDSVLLRKCYDALPDEVKTQLNGFTGEAAAALGVPGAAVWSTGPISDAAKAGIDLCVNDIDKKANERNQQLFKQGLKPRFTEKQIEGLAEYFKKLTGEKAQISFIFDLMGNDLATGDLIVALFNICPEAQRKDFYDRLQQKLATQRALDVVAREAVVQLAPSAPLPPEVPPTPDAREYFKNNPKDENVKEVLKAIVTAK